MSDQPTKDPWDDFPPGGLHASSDIRSLMNTEPKTKTPETDAETFIITSDIELGVRSPVVHAYVARRLEVERDQARKRADECWGAANYRLKYLAHLFRAIGLSEDNIENRISEAGDEITRCKAERDQLRAQIAAANSALHECLAATGEEAGDADDFRALQDRGRVTVEAVRSLRKENDASEAKIAARDEALKVARETLKNCLNNSPLSPFERADVIQSALRRIEELTKEQP